MRKLRLLTNLVPLLLCALVTRAQSVGQTFTVDGLTYTITSVSAGNYTVDFTSHTLGSSADVTVPATVVYGDNTFAVTRANCNVNAKSLTLSEGIEANTNNRVASTALHLPSTFTTLTSSWWVANNGCNHQTITVAEGNTTYKVVNNVLYTYNGETLLLMPMEGFVDADGVFTIQDGTKTIYWTNMNNTNTTANSTNGIRWTQRGNLVKKFSLPASTTNANYSYLNQWTANNAAYEVRDEAQTTTYKAVDGVLFNKAGTLLFAYPRAKADADYTISQDVTIISSYAFISNPNITTITAASGSKLTSIPANAINGCSALTSIDLSACTELTADGFEAASIADLANLETITLPSGVSLPDLIASGKITNCPKLTITVSDDDPNYSTDENGVLFNKDKTRLISCPQTFTGDADGAYTVPASVTEIADNAFERTQLTEVRFASNENLTTIGASAFGYSTSLTSFVVPKSVTSLGSRTFDNCTALTSLTFEEGSEITTIPNAMAYNCTALTTTNIPESVTALNGASIYRNTKIASLALPSNLKTMENEALAYMKSLTEITIPKSVTKIVGSQFYSCYRLKKITFEEDDEESMNTSLSLGYSNENGNWLSSTQVTELTLPKRCTTFSNSQRLTKVIVPDGSKLTTINALNGANYLESFVFEGSCPSLTTIGASAFNGYTKLTELHFPGSVANIGSQAFYGCTKLTSLTFGSETDPSQISAIGSSAFANCGITTFDIPSSVTSIDREAFNGCTDLTEVNVGPALTSLDPEAFKGCTSLTAYHVDDTNTVYADIDGYLTDKAKTTLLAYPQGKATGTGFTLMPPSLTAIGSHAFYGNTAVAKVILPANIQSIGNFAFLHDTGLRSLIFMGSSLIDPDNIKQGINDMAFDYPGISGAITDNIMDDITICLTKSAYQQWLTAKNEGAGNKYYDYYSKFKAIETTFTVDHADETGVQDEFMPVSDNEASLLSTASTADSYVLPATVTSGGKDYTVSMIADYAFENAPANISEVVVKGNPEYVGALAFATNVERDASGNVTGATSTIKDIIFTSSTPPAQLASVEFQLTDNYKEFLSDQKVYVKRSAKEAYQTAWPAYADKIETDIPMKAVSSQYATFTREFDVNLNPGNENWSSAKNMPKLTAFTAGVYGTRTNKDGEKEYVVRMRSINEGDSGRDGTYVPANTGVLLVATEGSLGAGELKYCIGEEDLWSYSGENLMQPVAEKGIESLTGTNGTLTNFYVAGGKLWPVQAAGISIPVHCSYLSVKVPSEVSNSKVVLAFEDFSDPTGISEITVENGAGGKASLTGNAPAYNLAGQRVTESYKGVVVKEGKKVIRK